MARLTRPDGGLFRRNRDGFPDAPSPALIEMLETAARMYGVTSRAFNVTIPPLSLAMDAAARRRCGVDDAELAAARARVGQRTLRFDARGVAFERPGMEATLNLPARRLTDDRVAASNAPSSTPGTPTPDP